MPATRIRFVRPSPSYSCHLSTTRHWRSPASVVVAAVAAIDPPAPGDADGSGRDRSPPAVRRADYAGDRARNPMKSTGQGCVPQASDQGRTFGASVRGKGSIKWDRLGPLLSDRLGAGLQTLRFGCAIRRLEEAGVIEQEVGHLRVVRP